MLCPVIYPVVQNIDTTFATSCGTPNLPRGILSTKPGTVSPLGIRPVSPIMAGETSFTVMLNSAKRVERFFIIDVRPPFDAA